MHAESDRKQQSERRAWEAPQVTDIDGTIESGVSPGGLETACMTFYIAPPS